MEIKQIKFEAACRSGKLEVVNALLADSNVDPSADNNYAIRIAAEKGHVKVVEVLLKDPRVDPAAKKNNAIRWAAANGHVEVVKVLLKDPRVDPTAGYNIAIKSAAEKGHVEVVKVLSKDPRVASSVDINHLIQQATQNNLEFVNLINTKRDADAAVSATRHPDVRPNNDGDTKKIRKDMAEVNEIFKNLARIVDDQSKVVECLSKTTEKNIETPKDRKKEKQQSASVSHFTFLKFLKLCGVFLLCSAVFLAIGGLIGGLFGIWPDINAFFEAIHLLTDWGIGVAVAAGGLALGLTNMVGWKAYGDVSLNPFHAILDKNNYSSHVRTIRTGWWQKIKDTFWVVAGEEHYFGVFDWFTLGIPFLLSALAFSALDTLVRSDSPVLPTILFFPTILLFIITVPLYVLRYAIAALLALITLPITGFVQSLVESSSLKENAMNLEITLQGNNESLHGQPKTTTLGVYLKEKNITLEDLAFNYSDSCLSKKQINFSIRGNTNVGFYYTPIFKTPQTDDVTNKQMKGNEAMLKLNVGGSANILEHIQRLDVENFVDTGQSLKQAK